MLLTIASRFRLVVEAAPSGILMVDLTGKIVLTNLLLDRMFGYEKGEVLGMPVETLIPERFRGNHPSHRTSFFEAPASRSMGAGRDLYGRRKDGSEIPVSSACVVLTRFTRVLSLSLSLSLSLCASVRAATRAAHSFVNSYTYTVW